ncbi:hypothetical protein [Flagellimonas okinawensis]|uniref:Cytochrome C n=1 Tax=Flagellimonas okinawensis TaxID=3031324 RepID=A0ABT5XN34_9FLAO|nr:hypothetical protein [[Muricauda] okinawensis]MDF0707297.1 hypothetical protein [[Muricauda] okinawensis]
MRHKLFVTIYTLLILSVVTSCSEKKKEKSAENNPVQQSVNPNGDSELAILMRQMFDEAETIKEKIANGEPIELSLDHEKMLTAHATEPEKAASAEYNTFAALYLQSIKNLESAKVSEVDSIYNNLVMSCLNCHKVLCPGPMVKIKKLQ